MKKLSFISKINKPIITVPCVLVLGVLVGNCLSELFPKIEKEDLIYPSNLSTKYLDLVGNDIIDEESSFKVSGNSDINISLESNFIKAIQKFSELYINTLKSDSPDFNFEDYLLKKNEDTYDGIALDLKENEFLYFIKKSNFEVIKKEEGFLTPDGNSAALKIIFKFTVDEITDPSKQSVKALEVGKTYQQERELHFKKTKNGEYKIYEQYIGLAEDVEKINSNESSNKKGHTEKDVSAKKEKLANQDTKINESDNTLIN